MNFMVAVILFPLLFRIGVPFEASMAGRVEPGGPAWEAGLQEGDRILSVNGQDMFAFRHLASAVALSEADQTLDLELETSDGGRRSLTVQPRFDEAMGFRRLGVGLPLDPELRLGVSKGSPAWEAGIRPGDKLLAVQGWRIPSAPAARVYLDHALVGDAPVTLTWDHAGKEVTAPLGKLSEEPAPPRIGVSSLATFVRGLRPGPLAGILRKGDRIRRAGDLDVRRPADFFAAAWHADGLPPLEILRDGGPVAIPADPSLAPSSLAAQVWLGVDDPLVLSVRPGSPAWKAGMRDGDRVLRVDGIDVKDFSQLAALVVPDSEADPETLPLLALDYQRGGTGNPIRVRVQPKTFPSYSYGLALQVLQETVRTRTFFEGISMGFAETRLQVQEVLLSIERMLTGDVSTRNLGGIITISEVTHSFAASGWIPLLFFLGTLSIYLAVFNLLPIPALDGGHLFLILVEKLRGRPLSERAQGMFHMVGFAIVLLLIVFVTWQDIRRLITR